MDLTVVYKRKKFWVDDFFHGSKMWKHYKDVHFIRTHLEEGEFLRRKYLKQILLFAHQNTPFYKQIPYSESLLDYPVINKQLILDNFDKFLTPLEAIPGQVGKLHVQKTSGSSGTPFALPQDTNCRIRRIATIKEENELIGFHSFEPMVHLRAMNHYYGEGEDIRWNKQLNIVYIDNSNLTPSKLERIMLAVNTSKAKVIRGYMTTLDCITRYAVERNISFKYSPVFISVGELLLESLRDRIVNSLHCQVISQYGNEENGIFGQSLINGSGSKIILNRANCFIEVLKFDSDEAVKPGELGRIVVTDFTNYAMPMIRYELGDIATIGEVHNGIILSLDKLSGRKTDIVYNTSGYPIDLFNSIPPEVYNNPQIRKWQFVQEEEKKYVLKLVLKNDMSKEDSDSIILKLKALLGQDSQIVIKYMDNIPLLKSGKSKIVICQYKKVK